jgi:hypothetical protein
VRPESLYQDYVGCINFSLRAASGDFHQVRGPPMDVLGFGQKESVQLHGIPVYFANNSVQRD